MLFGIVVSSILWRTGLATVFSKERIRGVYMRFERGLERVFGGVLVFFCVRLAISGQVRS